MEINSEENDFFFKATSRRIFQLMMEIKEKNPIETYSSIAAMLLCRCSSEYQDFFLNWLEKIESKEKVLKFFTQYSENEFYDALNDLIFGTAETAEESKYIFLYTPFPARFRYAGADECWDSYWREHPEEYWRQQKIWMSNLYY